MTLATGGELASPGWPDTYPPGSQCSWRYTAPPAHRVVLHVRALDMHDNALGHCTTAHDHVSVHDGLQRSAALVGFYCGRRPAFDVRSSRRHLLVVFAAGDSDNVGGDRRGFHADVSFELAPGDAGLGARGDAGPAPTDIPRGRETGASGGRETSPSGGRETGHVTLDGAGSDDSRLWYTGRCLHS